MTQKRKDLISAIIGNTSRTITSHIKESRLYLSLFEYFTDEELQEFIESEKIKKFDDLSKISIDDIDLILERGGSHENNKMLLCSALFKVDHGLEENLILPIFIKVIRTIDPLTTSISLKEQLLRSMNNQKFTFFTHENHKKIVKNFIRKYLTEKEIEQLYSFYISEVL